MFIYKSFDGVSVIHHKDVTVTYPLSYHGILVYLSSASGNWGGRDRTCDLDVNSIPLLPLSYTPIKVTIV